MVNLVFRRGHATRRERHDSIRLYSVLFEGLVEEIQHGSVRGMCKGAAARPLIPASLCQVLATTVNVTDTNKGVILAAELD